MGKLQGEPRAWRLGAVIFMDCTGAHTQRSWTICKNFAFTVCFLGEEALQLSITVLFRHFQTYFSFPFFRQNIVYSQGRMTSGKLTASAVSPHSWSNLEADREQWEAGVSPPQRRDGELQGRDMNRMLGFAKGQKSSSRVIKIQLCLH